MKSHVYSGSAGGESRTLFGLTALLPALMVLFLITSSPAAAAEDLPNIVVIVVDALRPDHLGCYGYDRPTSPNIDELATSAVRFETAITQAPWTKGSLASILTSRYPFQHEVTDPAAVMPEGLVTLPELLASKGYRSMFVVNMIGLAGRFGVLGGFDEVTEAEKHERNAVQTTDDAIAMMKASTEPYFIIVHYSDTHAPYQPPMPYVDLVGEGLNFDELIQIGRGDSDVAERARKVKRKLFYDGCIRYVDDQVGRIMDFLRGSGPPGRAVIVVTAGHGEALGERGVFGHGAGAYDDVVKVPLIVALPLRYGRIQTIRDQVRLFDLFPTFLEIAGIHDFEPGEATSLLPLVQTGKRNAAPGSLLPADVALCDCTDREVPGKIALRTGEWKLIVEPLTQLVEVYDLKNDPGETINARGGGSSMTDSLFSLLTRVPSAHPRGWRMALTGSETGREFRARVSLDRGARFSSVGKLVRIDRNLSITVAEDSRSFDLEASAGTWQMVLFDVEPEDAPVRFEITAEGDRPPRFASMGRSGKMPMQVPVALKTGDALGLPEDFESTRLSKQQGAFIWWLPGE